MLDDKAGAAFPLEFGPHCDGCKLENIPAVGFDLPASGQFAIFIQRHDKTPPVKAERVDARLMDQVPNGFLVAFYSAAQGDYAQPSRPELTRMVQVRMNQWIRRG